MQRIIGLIRSKSREEWNQVVVDKVEQARDYVRSQGERAALIAFGLGVFLVIFYRLVIIVACIVLVAHQLALIVADTAKK
jgi:hypothetical protein